MASLSVLIVDDSSTWLKILVGATASLLRDKEIDHEIMSAQSLERALQLIEERSFDLVTLDMRLLDSGPFNTDGMIIFDKINQKNADTMVIFISGYMTEGLIQSASQVRSNVDFIDKGDFDLYVFQDILAQHLL